MPEELPLLPGQRAPDMERLLHEHMVAALVEGGIDEDTADTETSRMLGYAKEWGAQLKRERIIARSPFKVGDQVFKPIGYEFPGTVVSVFVKKDGQRRLVVEDDRTLLHIFNEDQMEHVEPTTDIPQPREDKK